jgi:uncharacterized protein (DUF697 family)
MHMTARTIEELEQIRKECKSMVTKRAAASGGAVLVPVPGADVLADVGILMQLLPAINGKFGLSEKQLEGLDAETKSMVYGFITSIGRLALLLCEPLVIGMSINVMKWPSACWSSELRQISRATGRFHSSR